jgi:golgi SNAP receptor complex member 2
VTYAVNKSANLVTMTSIGELFPKCRKLAYDARQQYAALAQQQSQPSSDNMKFQLSCTLEELQRQLQVMNQLVSHELPSQREVWKQKILELQYEYNNIQKQSQQLRSNNIYHENREELLSLRQRRKQTTATSETDMNHLADEAGSLQQSHLMVDQLLDSGMTSLQSLQHQRRQLRGINGLMANIDQRLGITKTTMLIIERRDITDAYLVAAGMVVTLFVLYLTWIM